MPQPKKPGDGLAHYRSKRDFRKTSEPSGGLGPDKGGSGSPIFVIQQHDARRMHWDFRVESEGVLKSWALPKGPSTNPRDKRLAVATEDHPLQYANFEGVIPAGEYGAGPVIVWDAGPFENRSHDEGHRSIPLADALERGHAELWLKGKKLRGGYALINTKFRGQSENWLLIKMKDEGADARRNPTRTEPKSVLSGRTIAEVAESEAHKEPSSLEQEP